MRLLIWTLGVLATMHALMDAYAIAPRWVWVFWVWLGLWAFAGLVVVIAAAVRLATTRPSQAGPATAPRLPVPLAAPKGGE